MTTTASTQHHITVETSRPQLLGITDMVDGWPIVYVGAVANPAVRYRKYVGDYTRHSARPWKVGKGSYSTLPNALRALSIQA